MWGETLVLIASLRQGSFILQCLITICGCAHGSCLLCVGDNRLRQIVVTCCYSRVVQDTCCDRCSVAKKNSLGHRNMYPKWNHMKQLFPQCMTATPSSNALPVPSKYRFMRGPFRIVKNEVWGTSCENKVSERPSKSHFDS